jgi:hypothetical protein
MLAETPGTTCSNGRGADRGQITGALPDGPLVLDKRRQPESRGHQTDRLAGGGTRECARGA